jgi:hypothetical protein
LVDRGAGLTASRLAIRDEQKIWLPDSVGHTPPRRQIAGIIGPVSSKSFTQNRNPGRVQHCKALFELQKIRPVILAMAKLKNTVYSVLWVMVHIETRGIIADDFRRHLICADNSLAWGDENYPKIALSFHSRFIPGFKIFNT